MNVQKEVQLTRKKVLSSHSVESSLVRHSRPSVSKSKVILRNQLVQRVNKAKCLGVIADQHLKKDFFYETNHKIIYGREQKINWKDHISLISQKMSKSCGIIYRIRKTLDIKSKRLIYYSLIDPYTTYCVNVWSSTYRTNFKMLCTAQK